MRKTINVWLVAMVPAFFISILCGCNDSSTNRSKEELKVKEAEMSTGEPFNNSNFSAENPKIIPIKFLQHLEDINLSGTYFNATNYPNEKANKGDIVLYLNFSPDSKKIELKYSAYLSKNNRKIITNSDVLLSQTDDITYQVIQDNNNCIGIDKKLCFLREGERIGLSFDGVNIAFYDAVVIPNELSFAYLVDEFYSYYEIQDDSTATHGDRVEYYVDFDGIHTFYHKGRKYCLAFLCNYYWKKRSSREDGDWTSQLDVALYQVIQDEKVLVWFKEAAVCGTNEYSHRTHFDEDGEEEVERTYDEIAPKTKLQQIGNRYFITKERIDEVSSDYFTTTLVCYHPINLEEVFRLKFDHYYQGYSDEKSFKFRKEMNFSGPIEESAIVVYDWDLEKNEIKPSSISTHIYDGDKNKFVNLN